MNLAILGCGNWGSVFGIIQHANGHHVKIWEFDNQRAKNIQITRNNEPFLSGFTIPEAIEISGDINHVIEGADLIIFALPSQVLNGVVEKLKTVPIGEADLLSLTKGIDITSLRRPSEIIDQLGESQPRTMVLTGPCIANEIIRGAPTAALIVGSNDEKSKEFQHELTTGDFRLYKGDDIIGAELGAAMKNIIALGCGISDGLGFGNNAKGALITRGIIEIQRLGVKLGARSNTFWGLSGLGDLVTTSFSKESRNHRFGEYIAQGLSIDEITKKMVMVAEGVPTCKAIKILSKNNNIEIPISSAVYDILFHGKAPEQALQELMARPLKNE